MVLCLLAALPTHTGVVLYNDPKALIASIIGLAAAGSCLMSARSLTVDWTDLYFILFLFVSVVSGCFAATDRWESLREISLMVSGFAIFWSARHLADHGRRTQLLDAAALAVVLVAVSMLLDAFGFGLEAPRASSRGLQATRNVAAHLLALGMPLLALNALKAHRERAGTLKLGPLLISTLALTLTRARASWIATLVSTVLPLSYGSLASLQWLQTSELRTRCRSALIAMFASALIGVLLPTHLRWTSQNPYLESAEGLLAYDRGSGLARLQEYRRSLSMIVDHPALGVGPGNWRLVYPSYLPRSSHLDLWYPRRAHSDWIEVAAERGIPAFILLVAAFVSVVYRCWKSGIASLEEASSPEPAIDAICAISILFALVIVGSLDAVLQLPAPTFLVFLMLGALVPRQSVLASRRLSRITRVFAITLVLMLAGTFATYTLDQIYVTYQLSRDPDDHKQIALHASLDQSWYHNEKFWFWFDTRMHEQVASSRD